MYASSAAFALVSFTEIKVARGPELRNVMGLGASWRRLAMFEKLLEQGEFVLEQRVLD